MIVPIAAIAGAFLLGSIPAGLVISRLFFRTDIRSGGSGNIGAANALRTLGRGAGAAVLVLDALKGFAPPALVLHFYGPYATGIAMAAGFAAIVGHCYSPWLRGRGGKGVATQLGTLFALWWPAGLAFVAVWLAAAPLSGYSSVGSLLASVTSIATLTYVFGPAGAAYGVCSAAVVTWRHRENIARLRAGTENPMRGARGPSPSASKPGGLS